MPSTITPGVNLVAGQTTTVLPPAYADIGNNVVACIVYNLSAAVITVTGAFGQAFLQPLTADIYPCPTIQSAPFVSPTTITANGTYLGIAQAVFLFQGDTLPTNYPTPLTAFPGGSQLLAEINGTVSNGATVTYNVQPPPGSTFEFEITPVATTPIVGNASITITGNQTSIIYASQTLNLGQTDGPFVIPIPNLVSEDSSFSVAITAPASGTITFTSMAFAAPATPSPAFATTSTGRVSGTSAIIAAPSVSGFQAWYLFSADMFSTAAGGDIVIAGTTSGRELAFLIGGNGGNNLFVDHVDFGPLRVAEGVTATFAGTAGGLEVRYAPGP